MVGLHYLCDAGTLQEETRPTLSSHTTILESCMEKPGPLYLALLQGGPFLKMVAEHFEGGWEGYQIYRARALA